jgi:hypothetical protein
VLKVLALAKYDLVVILIDELETLNRLEPGSRSRALTVSKTFRDSLSTVAATPEYPPLAVIYASTEPFFFEQIRQYEPALYDRWRSASEPIQLNPLSEADIDNLIFRLRNLYFLAGRQLRPVRSTPQGPHEVIQLRNELLNSVAGGEVLTNRQLVTRLVRRVAEIWE